MPSRPPSPAAGIAVVADTSTDPATATPEVAAHRDRRARSSCSTSRPTPWPSRRGVAPAGRGRARLRRAPAGRRTCRHAVPGPAAGRLRRRAGHARRRLRPGAPGRPGPEGPGHGPLPGGGPLPLRLRPRHRWRPRAGPLAEPVSGRAPAAPRGRWPGRRGPVPSTSPSSARDPAAGSTRSSRTWSGPRNAMPPGIVGTILGAALSWFIHIAAGLVKGLVDDVPGAGPDAHPQDRRASPRPRRADRLGHAVHGPGHRRPHRHHRGGPSSLAAIPQRGNTRPT